MLVTQKVLTVDSFVKSSSVKAFFAIDFLINVLIVRFRHHALFFIISFRPLPSFKFILNGSDVCIFVLFSFNLIVLFQFQVVLFFSFFFPLRCKMNFNTEKNSVILQGISS